MKPFVRFLIGFSLVLVVLIAGFTWLGAVIPNWGAAKDEISRPLPGDELVPNPQLVWNHAITIQAPPEAVYPWLAQMGDSRGGFYSYTMIENLFMIAGGLPDRYRNAAVIHPEWQDPPPGQGIIVNYMAIQETVPNSYVLAGSTPEMPGVLWTWLWYLEPTGTDSTRLIVRHRFQLPPEAPFGIVNAVFNAGYVMERGMLHGIRDRAEGRALPGPLEGFEAVLWLCVLGIGIAAAVRYMRLPSKWHSLSVGLEAVIALFLFTFVQPPIWMRIGLLLVLAVSLWIAFRQKPVVQSEISSVSGVQQSGA